MIRLAALFLLVVGIATWVLFASSILDAVGDGGRASVLDTVTPSPTREPVATATASATPTTGASPEASPTGTATAHPDGEQTYVIEPGDNLIRIANRFGVTLEALQAANGIDDPSSIRAGQEIVIPAPEDE